MIKAIIFDMDGVLIDSTKLHYLAYKKALRDEDIEITKKDYIVSGAGKSNRSFFEDMSKKYAKEMNFAEIERRKRNYFVELMEEKLELREGITKLLQKLHGKYTLAVASSTTKRLVNMILKKFQIDVFFDSVLGGDEVANMKPAPDIYIEMIRQLGLESSVCVAIEDSTTGVIAAKRAGMKCVAVPGELTVTHDFSGADMVIDKLEEFDPKQLETTNA